METNVKVKLGLWTTSYHIWVTWKWYRQIILLGFQLSGRVTLCSISCLSQWRWLYLQRMTIWLLDEWLFDAEKQQEILGLGWDFDYVMNISESDYPVRWNMLEQKMEGNLKEEEKWICVSLVHVRFKFHVQATRRIWRLLEIKGNTILPIYQKSIETWLFISPPLLKVGRNFVATSGKEMLKFQDGQVLERASPWFRMCHYLKYI